MLTTKCHRSLRLLDDNVHVADGTMQSISTSDAEPKPGLLRSLGRRAGRAILQASQEEEAPTGMLSGPCHPSQVYPANPNLIPPSTRLFAEIKLDPAMEAKMMHLGEDLTPRDRALSFLY